METLVLLAIVPENTEASLIKTYLESNEVPCMLNDVISNQLLGSVINQGGVEISVMQKHLPQAKEKMLAGGFEKYLV